MNPDSNYDKIYQFKASLENKLTILGATAIEDKLQENLV